MFKFVKKIILTPPTYHIQKAACGKNMISFGASSSVLKFADFVHKEACLESENFLRVGPGLDLDYGGQAAQQELIDKKMKEMKENERDERKLKR